MQQENRPGAGRTTCEPQLQECGSVTPAGVFLRRMGTTEPSWSGTSGSGTAQRSRSADAGERASGAPSLPLSVVLEAPPPGARRCGCSRLASSSALSAGPPPHASSSGLGETLAPLSPTLPAPPHPPPCCSCSSSPQRVADCRFFLPASFTAGGATGLTGPVCVK